MNVLDQLAQDFAGIVGEFTSQAPALRTVAALNPSCSKAEFVQAAVAAGYNAHSAGARFGESRRLDAEMCDMVFDKDGREFVLEG
jgi:hypothetical protein